MPISRDIKPAAQSREVEKGCKFGIDRLWMVREAKGADEIIQGENVK